MKIAIIGAGGVGSAAARFLAQDGHEVVLLEQFALDHDRGSSFGESRIIRYTYPDRLYTKMMGAAYPLWDALQQEAGEELFVRCGGLYFGPSENADIRAVEEALRANGVPYERLSAEAANARFPGFRLFPGEIGIFQADSGFLRASSCVKANVRLACQHGAELCEQVKVRAFRKDGKGFKIETDGGERSAERVVLTPGPWLGTMLGESSPPLSVTRQQYAYLRPARHPEWFEPGRFPVWIEAADGPSFEHYGFPADGRVEGVKFAYHGKGPECHPDQVDRTMDPKVLEDLRAYAARRMPELSAEAGYTQTCLYTNTPDHDFIIDAVPGHPGTVVIGGCSGHGFKFTVLLGRIAADWVSGGRSPYDLSRFRLARFAS